MMPDLVAQPTGSFFAARFYRTLIVLLTEPLFERSEDTELGARARASARCATIGDQDEGFMGGA